jgi:aminoglycoside phosphotransferase (APT) family kinase protein
VGGRGGGIVTKLKEAAFPGLGRALDLEAVAEHFRDALPECRDGMEVEGVTILDVRYRPGGPCWILYRLKVRRPGKRSTRQLVSARLLGPSERAPEVPADLLERYRDGRGYPIATAVIEIPSLHMVAYPYPVDAALPGLFDAADARSMKLHLGRLWEDRGVRVRQVLTKPLGYTPEARAAFAYEVLAEARKTGIPEMRRLIGKMHAKKPAHRLFADQWALWRAGSGRLSVAPPVGYLGAIGLTLQEEVRGIRLGALVERGDFRVLARRTARAIAELHGVRAPLSSRRRPADEADTVHRWAGVLRAIRSDVARRVERLRDHIASDVARRTRPTAPIHADFHHTNVLVHGGRVMIIDLDEMAYGDPMVDVGRFLASLRVPSRRAFGDIGALGDAGEAFLQEYFRKAPGDERRARLFEASSLLIAAGSSFRIQRANWEEEVVLLLDEAERVAALSADRTAVAAARSEGRPKLDAEERRRWARDPAYMAAVLDPHVRESHGVQVGRVRVEGSSSSSSERVRYRVHGVRTSDDGPVSLALEGVLRREGRGVLRRLEAVRTALSGATHAPQLPRSVGYLAQLGLVVWEVPVGVPFSELVGQPAGRRAAADIGRALATLHGAPVTLDHRRPLDVELAALGRRVEGLHGSDGALALRARTLLESVERRWAAAEATLRPVVRTVHPRHVVHGDSVGLADVRDVTMSHPFLDAADFLGRLAVAGVRHDSMADAAASSASFRDSYGSASSVADDLASFEAAALLRLGCREITGGHEGWAAELLTLAEEVLA